MHKQSKSTDEQDQVLHNLKHAPLSKNIKEMQRNPAYLGLTPLLFRMSEERKGNLSAEDMASNYARRESAVAKVTELIRRYKAGPDIPTISQIPRSEVSDTELSLQDLKDAGFVPSYMAVPERGQTQIRTWRHPLSGVHFHKHKGKWRYHIDQYPSMAMSRVLKRRLRDAGIEPKKNADTRETAKMTFAGLKHVLQEGVPGYVNWAAGTIIGRPGLGYEGRPSLMRSMGGSVLCAAGLAGLSRGVTQFTGSKSWNMPESLAAVGAFVGGEALASKLYETAVNKNMIQGGPSWKYMAINGVAPVAAGIGTYALVNSLRKKLRKNKTTAEVGEKAKALPRQPAYLPA